MNSGQESGSLERGRAHWDAGRFQEAIPELQAAKREHPLEAGYLLARCFMKIQVYNMAVKEFIAAREAARPEHRAQVKEITYMLGRIYEQAKKHDKAIAEYRRILELDRPPPSA